MDRSLLKEALIKVISGMILLGVLLFIPAGTLKWKNGWLFLAVLFIPMIIGGTIMYLKAPDLLRSRLKAKETQKDQKEVIGLSALMFIAVFVVAGLDWRFGWSKVSDTTVIIAVIIFLLAYLMFGEVLRENAWLSRTIEVQDGQQVVDTGLYGVVRHPMYTATVFLFLMMPLILGSMFAFVIMWVYIPIIVKRIKNEEEVLEKELKGYTEYKKKIRYRLIPFIW